MVTPLAKPQYTAARASRTPGPIRVDGGGRHGYGQRGRGSRTTSETWVRPVAIPGSGVMASIFSTIHCGEEGVTVIDPGWVRRGREREYLQELDTFLRDRGRRLEQITQVIVTHAHPDHLAAASCLLDATRARFIAGAQEWRSVDAARTGAEVDAYPLTAETTGAPAGVLDDVVERRGRPGVPAFIPRRTPDVLLADGDRLTGPGPSGEVGVLEASDIEVLVTPGHTPGHLCLVSREKKTLLAADMILPEIHPGIGLGIGQLGGNSVVDYLTSLERIGEFDDYLIIPGHGYVFTGLGQRRRETAHHVLARAREVSRVLEWNPEISVWRLASQLTWSAGWEGVRESPMLFSGLRQTMMYRDLVLSGEQGPAGQDGSVAPGRAVTSVERTALDAAVNNTGNAADTADTDVLTHWEKTFDLSS